MVAATATDVMLDTMEALDIPYFLGNGGTDFPDIVESFSNRLASGKSSPTPLTVVHENLAISMAHGHYLGSGQMLAVMLHVTVGTANAACGFINAARDQVPVLLLAGRTPLTESGFNTSRNVFIHWGQESFDQGAMLREYAKWDYELRAPDQIAPAIARATAIATSSPPGPVYLTLPREYLNAPVAHSPHRQVKAQDPDAPAENIEQLNQALLDAKRPLLITSATGRTEEGFSALTEFAERYQVAVVEFRPRCTNLPCSAATHAGFDPHKLLVEADLIIAADVDVPWIPSFAAPSPSARVAVIGEDPLFESYPYWGFPVDYAFRARSSNVFRSLTALQKNTLDREDWIQRACKQRVSPARAGFTFSEASRILAETLPDAIFVNENPIDPSELRLERFGHYYASSPAGGLGWGLGAALGVKLAKPDALVVCAVGDGSYMFGGPTPFHYTSSRYGLPVLTVIFNNQKYGGVERASASVYPDRNYDKMNDRPFIDLHDSPDFGMISASCGGAAFTASSADELRSALAEAAAVVKSGRQALVNLRIG